MLVSVNTISSLSVWYFTGCHWNTTVQNESEEELMESFNFYFLRFSFATSTTSFPASATSFFLLSLGIDILSNSQFPG